MSSESHEQCARFVFRIATLFPAFVFLTLVTTTTAQTKDYPQPSASKAPLGQISGHVYRSDTEEPIPKAQVELSAANEETAKAAGPERIVRTSGDGAFVFLDLPAGSYQFEVWRNGFAEISCNRSRTKTTREPPPKETSLSNPGKSSRMSLCIFTRQE